MVKVIFIYLLSVVDYFYLVKSIFFNKAAELMFCLIATADRGCKLEEELGEDQGKGPSSHQAVGLAEQLGDLYCKVGCYSKALDAYQAQVKHFYQSFLLAPDIYCVFNSSPVCVYSRYITTIYYVNPCFLCGVAKGG